MADDREVTGARTCILAGGQLRIFPNLSRAGQNKAVTANAGCAHRCVWPSTCSHCLFHVLRSLHGLVPRRINWSLAHGPWSLYRATVQSVRRETEVLFCKEPGGRRCSGVVVEWFLNWGVVLHLVK